jgi:hypothetical protein
MANIRVLSVSNITALLLLAPLGCIYVLLLDRESKHYLLKQ